MEAIVQSIVRFRLRAASPEVVPFCCLGDEKLYDG